MNFIRFSKKYFIVGLTIIFIGGILQKLSSRTIPLDRSELILTPDNKPTPALTDLLFFFNQPLMNFSELVAYTQREWLRKPGLERWQVEEKYEESRQILIPLFQKLGMIDNVKPIKKEYCYVLILGATVDRVRSRLFHLQKLCEQGIKFDFIILLGGQRPLDKEIESEAHLFDYNSYLPIRKDWHVPTVLPSTEIEMMKMVVDQSDLPLALKEKMIFIDTPMQLTAEGKQRRPNTADTIKSWLATSPLSGSCLCISSQPFVGYQDSVIRTYLPSDFIIETVGLYAFDDCTVVACLDTLARWLYQENIRRSRND
jgi:hypothetical protein